MSEFGISFGLIAGLLQIAFLCIGVPRQIWLLARTKDASSHSVMFHAIPSFTSVFWLINATTETPNVSLALASGLGALFGATLTVQVVYYRYLAGWVDSGDVTADDGVV